MNTNLISNITGKEFYIVDLITKLSTGDYGLIMPDKPIIYKDGRYNTITITYKGNGTVSKKIFNDNKDAITITSILGSFDNVEFLINDKIINVYKDYQFTICICDKYFFDINAKLIELDEVSVADSTRLNEIKSLYNKIKSISLIDNTIFKSNTVILGYWKINVLFNYVGSVDLTEVVYKGIAKLLTDGMTKIGPMDSDSK